jgi:hypothetical protein
VQGNDLFQSRDEVFAAARAANPTPPEARPPHLIGSATCHWAYEWLYGPCVSGTSLDFDRQARTGPPHRDGGSDRNRLTRTPA